MRMLSVDYLPEDCSSPVDNGAPTRTRTADLLITNYMAPVFIELHGYSFLTYKAIFIVI